MEMRTRFEEVYKDSPSKVAPSKEACFYRMLTFWHKLKLQNPSKSEVREISYALISARKSATLGLEEPSWIDHPESVWHEANLTRLIYAYRSDDNKFIDQAILITLENCTVPDKRRRALLRVTFSALTAIFVVLITLLALAFLSQI